MSGWVQNSHSQDRTQNSVSPNNGDYISSSSLNRTHKKMWPWVKTKTDRREVDPKMTQTVVQETKAETVAIMTTKGTTVLAENLLGNRSDQSRLQAAPTPQPTPTHPCPQQGVCVWGVCKSILCPFQLPGAVTGAMDVSLTLTSPSVSNLHLSYRNTYDDIRGYTCNSRGCISGYQYKPNYLSKIFNQIS